MGWNPPPPPSSIPLSRAPKGLKWWSQLSTTYWKYRVAPLWVTKSHADLSFVGRLGRGENTGSSGRVAGLSSWITPAR